ncbi:hypothetical protein E8L90_06320 [Brevibacillus antibioticus]|uniref:Tyr recombinase domain-containing protein n=1 Tax=Brevibacillus antibioticus TaxID=2570228 RepID=A0A4U2Y4R7_9BACL|nr:hypothetical protein E8L90_06320 [Brevibacillus antibioticus]
MSLGRGSLSRRRNSLIEELIRHRSIQQEDRRLFGDGYLDQDFIIAKNDGEPLKRHTHATLMLKIGEHPKIVSKRLGHSSIQMTLNVYSQVTFDMQKESALFLFFTTPKIMSSPYMFTSHA